MPQLIAMVIVVVGAMIYMFQTFGGTGDKIEGVAQKTSVITELNNIKNALQIAARTDGIKTTTTLKALADDEYFASQINVELSDNTGTGHGAGKVNTYAAISFGGETGKGMLITLLLPSSANKNQRPGLFVDLTQGTLFQNSAFLEKQLLTDLKATATIESKAGKVDKDGKVTGGTFNADLDKDGNIATDKLASTGTETDGVFTIYFKDIQPGIE